MMTTRLLVVPLILVLALLVLATAVYASSHPAIVLDVPAACQPVTVDFGTP